MEINEVPLIRQSIFESLITNVDNDALVKELRIYYLNKSSGDGKKDSQNMKFPIAGPESEKLQDEILKRVEIVSGKKMKCKEFWMFSMNNGGSVPRHNHKTNYQLHPEEYYSVSYYPLCEEDGADIFFIANYCNTLENLISIKTQTGKLIIFNSFIDHYTSKHMSNSERICISANYKPEMPDESVVSDWTRFARPGVAGDSRIQKFS